MPEITCLGVKVPPSPLLTEARIRRIRTARYEGEEIAGALAVCRPGDRVVEFGTGLGLVSAVVARHAQPESLLSFEANADLIPHIRALHALNGLEARITLRNAVVLSAPEPPATVPFYRGPSYLGNSLIDRPGRAMQPVAVATERWQAVVAESRPTVLIMDIEGGELDFLIHADLSALRAIVLEFHPELYGHDGMRRCREALHRAGFGRLAKVSTPLVWTCVRPEGKPDARILRPKPQGGWSTTLRSVKGAVVAPPQSSKLSTPSGVIDAAGRDVPEAALWRHMRRINLPFRRPAQTETLPGRWLWGGVMYRNFAHFVAESPGRLWGYDAAPGQLDGVVFVPRRPRPDPDMAGFRAQVFEALGLGDVPVRVLHSPTTVEELIVPGQGFGLGAITEGTQIFRAFMQRRFGAGIAPEGPERLYVSRAGLGPSRGALLGEEQVEAHMQAAGYTVFRPERHPIATQIARYKAAREIVASEGSALHLYAFCGRAEQRVAILCRRRSASTAQIAQHIASFTGRAPVVIDHLRAVWQNIESSRARLAVGEPDLPAMQASLRAAGFLEAGGPDWPPITEAYAEGALGHRYRREAAPGA
jgi:FkbM family methyltransferase